MKKIGITFSFFAMLLVGSIAGCGSKGSTVIEAPTEPISTQAMEGVEDDEYAKAMEKSMKQQGN